MRKVFVCLIILVNTLYAFALTESEGTAYIKNYYGLLNQYATADSPTLVKKVENMHVGNGYVYPDIRINIDKLPTTKGMNFKSVYMESINANRNLLLTFVPKNISLEGNNNGVCTMAYTLYVYSGNERPGQDVLKYTVPLKMEIQNSDKKIRSILKRTKTTPQYTLSVSPSSLSFDASGGTQTITVSSTTDWEISVHTASWGHLTRSGNTLTLRVDENTSTTSRADYFKIKAGDREEKITINQSAPAAQQPTAQIRNVSISHNHNLDGGKGMIIYVSFSIQNMKNKNGRVVAYFYDKDGNRIKDTNGKFNTSGSNVCTYKNINPTYDNSGYDSLRLEIPYSELHQTGTYTRTLKLSITIWDESVSPNKALCRNSSYTAFSYTPEVESFLKINGSTSDKTKYFSKSGGRETYSINTNASSYETWGVPDWCSIENKTSSSFTLVCSPNTTSEERKDWMKIKAGGKEIRIDIKQEGGVVSYTLSVSQSSFSFGASGGTRTITVNSNTDWSISVPTASWGHLTRSGNTLTLRVDANTSTSSRTDYFKIKAGDKEEKINISQGPATAYTLSVSPSNLSFSAAGGSQTITVSSNTDWEISVNPYSWGHLTRSGNTLTLRVDANTSNSSRTDFIKIKAGDKEQQINISQEGKYDETIIHKIWINHNLWRSMYNGFGWVNVPYMRIHCHFKVYGHKGENIRVCAFFYFANGNRVNAVNAEFRTSDGQATVQGTGHCNYEGSEWKDYFLDIPYYALPKGNLTVQIQIQDKNGGFLANSSHYSFTLY